MWFLNQRLLTLMLNNSFSSHIILTTVEYTAFVIDESSVVDSYRSSSCLDNDEFCLDFWSKDHWWLSQKWTIHSKISRTSWQSAVLDHLYKAGYSICNRLLGALQQRTYATMLAGGVAPTTIPPWHDRLWNHVWRLKGI